MKIPQYVSVDEVKEVCKELKISDGTRKKEPKVSFKEAKVILVSAVTFTIYFVTIGMILREFKYSGSRMSSMVNGVICASSSSFGRDK